jgi:hypothetical protein
MKNKKILFAVLAIALVLGMTACPGGGDVGSYGTQVVPPPPSTPDPESVTYAGYTAEDAYTLTITQSSARYTAVSGDSYIMSIAPLSGGAVKTSKGEVTLDGTTFTLSKGGTVTVNSAGGITATTAITLDDDTTQGASSVTPTNSTEAPKYKGKWTGAVKDTTGSFSISINEDGTFVYEYPYSGKLDFTVKGTYVTTDDKAVFVPANFKHEGKSLCYPEEETDFMKVFSATVDTTLTITGVMGVNSCTKK